MPYGPNTFRTQTLSPSLQLICPAYPPWSLETNGTWSKCLYQNGTIFNNCGSNFLARIGHQTCMKMLHSVNWADEHKKYWVKCVANVDVSSIKWNSLLSSKACWVCRQICIKCHLVILCCSAVPLTSYHAFLLDVKEIKHSIMTRWFQIHAVYTFTFHGHKLRVSKKMTFA